MGSSRDLGLPPYPSLASGPGPKPLELAERVLTLSSLLSEVGEASLLLRGTGAVICGVVNLIMPVFMSRLLYVPVGLPACSTLFAAGLDFSEMCDKFI